MIYEEIYNKRINSLEDKFDTSIRNNGILLDRIKDEITNAYAKGTITEQHYNLLNNKISDHKKLTSTSTGDDDKQ